MCWQDCKPCMHVSSYVNCPISTCCYNLLWNKFTSVTADFVFTQVSLSNICLCLFWTQRHLQSWNMTNFTTVHEMVKKFNSVTGCPEHTLYDFIILAKQIWSVSGCALFHTFQQQIILHYYWSLVEKLFEELALSIPSEFVASTIRSIV